MKFSLKLLGITAFMASAVLVGCKKNSEEPPVTQSYKADANGATEVPSNSSTATATFNGTYNSSTKTFSGTLTYTGITPTGWKIERGTATTTGSLVVSLGAVVVSPLSFSVTLDAAAEAELKAGDYYINVSSAAYPAGEIRGKIVMN